MYIVCACSASSNNCYICEDGTTCKICNYGFYRSVSTPGTCFNSSTYSDPSGILDRNNDGQLIEITSPTPTGCTNSGVFISGTRICAIQHCGTTITAMANYLPMS